MFQFLPWSVSGRRAARSMQRTGGSAVLVCFLVAVLEPGAAMAQAMSLAEAEQVAIARDAILRQVSADAEAMRHRAVMDGQLMDPKLRFGAVNVPTDSFSLRDDDMTMLEVGVSQEFAPGDSRELARKRMDQTAAAMESVALDRGRQVRREVRKLWTQLAYVDGCTRAAGPAGGLGGADAAFRACALRLWRGQATRRAAGGPRCRDAA